MQRNNTSLVGRLFGRLTVLEKLGLLDAKNNFYKCLCTCGNIKSISRVSLVSGDTQSCGCLNRELTIKRLTTHGKRYTREYKIWCNMLERCNNDNNMAYDAYGGRGIRVSEEWLCFENFIKDMGICPKQFTLERMDNNLGYNKENCKWASRKEQARNRRSSLILSYNGTTKLLCEWSEELHIPYKTLYARIFRGGWSVSRALELWRKYGQ